MYSLSPPELTAKYIPNNSILLSWNKVEGAVEYQIFEYNEDTKLFRMVDRTSNLTYVINYLEIDEKIKYIVQSISYTELSDNVSSEYAIKPISS